MNNNESWKEFLDATTTNMNALVENEATLMFFIFSLTKAMADTAGNNKEAFLSSLKETINIFTKETTVDVNEKLIDIYLKVINSL